METGVTGWRCSSSPCCACDFARERLGRGLRWRTGAQGSSPAPLPSSDRTALHVAGFTFPPYPCYKPSLLSLPPSGTREPVHHKPPHPLPVPPVQPVLTFGGVLPAVAGPSAGLAGDHLSLPPQVGPAQEKGADEGAEAEPQQQVHHQPRLLLHAHLLLQHGRGRRSRDQGGWRRGGGRQGTRCGPGRDEMCLETLRVHASRSWLSDRESANSTRAFFLGKNLKAATHRLCLLAFLFRGEVEEIPSHPLFPLFPLLPWSRLNPNVGIADLRGNNPSPPAPPPQGLEAAQQGEKFNCWCCSWLVEPKDRSVKHPAWWSCVTKKTEEADVLLFFSPVPVPWQRTTTQPPQDEGKGVCCPFPNFGPITWLLFQLSPGGSRPTPPLCLPLRAALLSQVGAHCLGCCPQMVVQLMHFFRSSS